MNKILDKLMIILVDQPGRERDALKAILTSMKNVREIELINEYKDLHNWFSVKYPDVVVIRERSDDQNLIRYIKDIKAANPHLRFLVITETTKNIEELVEAGADHVFLKGFSSIELDDLLNQWSMEKILKYFVNRPDPQPLPSLSTHWQLLV